MANIRVKDLDTKASFASDDEILMDSPSGTGTMLRDAFIAAVASQIVAAPSTYKIATLDGADKLTSSQDPSQSVSYLGGHDMVANSPALADGSGTAGDTYYVTNPGTRNYGSGNITAQEGDALVYSGSVWQLVEGIANILDGISTASTARTTLAVNSIDEDAEATGTKLVGPAMYFNGTSSVVTVAQDTKFNFTDGTDDLPWSVSAWVKLPASSPAGTVFVSKWNAAKEFSFQTDISGKLQLYLSDATDNINALAPTALPTEQWIHVSATYAGTSGGVFTSAADGISLYLNGVAYTGVTATNNASYGGLGVGAGTDNITIGQISGSTEYKMELRGLQFHNRELTATEVAQLARGNDLGFADEWGGALGGVKTYDFSAGLDGLTAFQGTAVGNIDAIDGKDDNLRFTVNTAAAAHGLYKNAIFTPGKRYRVTAEIYVYSTNSEMDGLVISTASSTSPSARIAEGISVTPDTWVTITGEAIALSDYLYIYGMDGESGTFTDAGGNDQFYIHSLKITALGKLADFRAENFIADKLIDQSSNNFVGTNNGATLVGGRKALQLDTDGAAAGNNVLSVFNGSSHLAYVTDKGDLNANSISSGASTELTIATGAVTATKSYHTIDTESDAASDDLDTISGGRAGQMLIVQANNSARSVVLKDGTGNLKLSGDITLDNAEDTATLVSDGTSWYLIATSNNGA